MTWVVQWSGAARLLPLLVVTAPLCRCRRLCGHGGDRLSDARWSGYLARMWKRLPRTGIHDGRPNNPRSARPRSRPRGLYPRRPEGA